MSSRKGRQVALFAVLAIALAGCASPPKEKTAPCKRPSNALAYGPVARSGCGPMRAVNNNPAAAFAAIRQLEAE